MKALGAQAFKDKKFDHKLKIAILDDGFNGWEKEKANGGLPSDTQYDPGPLSEADCQPNNNFHGTTMAKLFVQILSLSGAKTDYDLHLINTFGLTKFKAAVQKVIDDSYDVVLYAQVWENAGFGDGRGFINKYVDQAVKAGVIWINAAGNFGRMMKLAPIDSKMEGKDEWVLFKDGKSHTSDSVKFDCRAPKGQKCADVSIVLAWNDFKDDEDQGTDKDLDLFLLNGKNQQIAASQLRQKLNPTEKGDSGIPREYIKTHPGGLEGLDPGTYKIKVLNYSKNFSTSHDQLRLTFKGFHLQLENPTLGETLLPPADNPGVIVIGAKDDPNSSGSKKLKKPDVSFPSIVRMKGGAATFETSNASAIAAAMAALYLGTGTDKTRDAVVAALKISPKKELMAKEKPAEKVEAKAGTANKTESNVETKTETKAERKPAETTEKPVAAAKPGEKPAQKTVTAVPETKTEEKPAEKTEAPAAESKAEKKPEVRAETSEEGSQPGKKHAVRGEKATGLISPNSKNLREAKQETPPPALHRRGEETQQETREAGYDRHGKRFDTVESLPPAPHARHEPLSLAPPHPGSAARPLPAQSRVSRSGCLRPIDVPMHYPAVNWLLGKGGGVAVMLHGHPTILVNYDYSAYMKMPPPPGPDAHVFVTPNGPAYGTPDPSVNGVPPGYYEVIMSDAPVCD